MNIRVAAIAVLTFAIALISLDAYASVTVTGGGHVGLPTTTGFGGILYDLGVTNILGGPIGRLIGTGIFAVAGYLAYKQEVVGAVLAALGALVIMNADSMVASLSAII